jgi:hypothetical protein
MRLKQELPTTAKFVNGFLKREKLKREASWQAKARGCCAPQGVRCGNPGTSRSGDGPDQRARLPLGRRNGGELFAYCPPYFHFPLTIE